MKIEYRNENFTLISSPHAYEKSSNGTNSFYFTEFKIKDKCHSDQLLHAFLTYE
ncbi:hypothetical protein ACQWU4_15815 [Chryseobacterium sp. MIQD13]|uniref:hypothetical protein n=1 Tax=Chryseobacterium sp. MIQD13 TaxID=3422310 RepID=UPI003D286C3D